MKQEVLQMLKCIDKNEKRIKVLVHILAQAANQAIGKQNIGRKRMKMTYVICGIMYYLRTGRPWHQLPSCFGNYKTIYGWYRKICKLGIFKKISESALKDLVKQKKLSLKDLLIDGSLATCMNGGELMRKNPRNHGKGTINRLICANGKGIPLTIQLAPGTAHDSPFFSPILRATKRLYGLPKNFRGHADKGFDSFENRMLIGRYKGNACIPVRNHGFAPGVPCPKLKDKIRWKIERSISWFNKFRSLHSIYARTKDSILQLHFLGAIIILSRKLSLRVLKNLNWSIS